MKSQEIRRPRSAAPTVSPADAPQEKPYTDPVCGMKAAANPEKSAEHDGQTYYFCSKGCVTKFNADPLRYLSPETQPAFTAPLDAVYTCPMDPEIQQIGPGSCPKCGMALEPMQATMQEDTHELDDMTRRFMFSLLLSLPLLLLTMGDIATPVVLWFGAPFLQRATQSFRTGHLNMFSLIGVGVMAAWLFSLLGLIAPDFLPVAFTMGGMAPLYFEASAVIVTLVLLGQVLELRARSRTNAAVRSLLALTPNTAIQLQSDGSEKEVPLEKIQKEDRLRIKPGTTIPVDGVVIDGHSTVDESMITGESMPTEKNGGSKLVAGTVNQNGSLVMRAEKIGADTLLSKIVNLVNQAGRSRAPIQKLADRVSGWFVPTVMVIAVLSFILWATLGPSPGMAHGLVAAVSVLIIACPCALGLATPTAILVGSGIGAERGLLIKGGDILERVHQLNIVVFDKTGTLTTGSPMVTDCITISELSPQQILQLAATVEQGSNHPISEAILREAKEQNLSLLMASDFQTEPGLGVSAIIENQTIFVGNLAGLIEHKINYPETLPEFL